MPGSFSKSFAANNYNHSQSYACKIFNKCWNWRDFGDRHESSCSSNSRFRIRRVTKFSKFFTQKSKIPDQYRFLVTKRIISVPMDNIHISESTNWQHTIIQIHFLRWVVSRHKRGGSERGQKKKSRSNGFVNVFFENSSYLQSVSQICQMSQKRQCHKSQFRVRFTVFSWNMTKSKFLEWTN